MCVSLWTIESWIIWLIVICAVVAIVRLLLVPFVLAPLGQSGALIIQVLNIVVWVIVAIACVWIIFDLLACALGSGGTGIGIRR